MYSRFASAALLLICVGCTSISSTLLNRTDNDVFVGNSNGDLRAHCQPRPFKGVPITIRVPTHLDIAVKETIFLRKKDGSLFRLKTPKRQLFVEPKLIETDKVFSVDFKRPAAGTLDYTMQFGDKANNVDNSQYFKSIKSKIVDKTIQDVTTALETVVPSIQKLATARPTSAGGLQGEVIEENRVVAWKRFDLDAPDFEQQVLAFLEMHINCCNNCLAYPDSSYPAPATQPSLPPLAPIDSSEPTSDAQTGVP